MKALVVAIFSLAVLQGCSVYMFQRGAKVWVRRERSTKTGVVKSSRDARVVFAAPTVNPASQTFRVRLEMKNTGHAWKAGLKVWIEKPEEDR